MAFSISRAPEAALQLEPALYVVATPIGNLADITLRALQVLEAADQLYAEDTRNTRRLLAHFGLQREVTSCHEHNEQARIAQVLSALASGQSVALVSDAGTPLISDPGYLLVRAMREADRPVIAVPGACAGIAALSVSGMPCHEFLFVGFLPARASARNVRLRELLGEPRLLVLYEAGRRVVDLLAAITAAAGADRPVVLLRELTKLHEECVSAGAGDLHARALAGELELRGEFVVLIAPAPERDDIAEAVRVRDILLKEMPPSRAARVAAQITGVERRRLYEKGGSGDPPP